MGNMGFDAAAALVQVGVVALLIGLVVFALRAIGRRSGGAGPR